MTDDGTMDSDQATGGGWVATTIAMLAAVAWIIATVHRHGAHWHSHPLAPSPSASAGRATPQEILAERLARGEIESGSTTANGWLPCSPSPRRDDLSTATRWQRPSHTYRGMTGS